MQRCRRCERIAYTSSVPPSGLAAPPRDPAPRAPMPTCPLFGSYKHRSTLRTRGAPAAPRRARGPRPAHLPARAPRPATDANRQARARLLERQMPATSTPHERRPRGRPGRRPPASLEDGPGPQLHHRRGESVDVEAPRDALGARPCRRTTASSPPRSPSVQPLPPSHPRAHPRREPRTLEAARMSRTHMLYDDSRAETSSATARAAIEAVEGSAGVRGQRLRQPRSARPHRLGRTETTP